MRKVLLYKNQKTTTNNSERSASLGYAINYNSIVVIPSEVCNERIISKEKIHFSKYLSEQYTNQQHHKSPIQEKIYGVPSC